ncbi:MAG: hypothetical protein EAZ16_10750 [Sphingobacteriales bacterium]|jgi:hypothetical protein|nr:MAG: hypothetical protein EAZ16_10750 [Sphingobacteriales bacterium]
MTQRRWKFTILSITALFFAVTAYTQNDVIRLEQCMNQSYTPQIDSLKKLFAAQGFVVVREASMKMESEYEMPIIVPLTQGSFYQFVFIGEPTSKLYEVRMYDWNEKEVVFQQKRWGDVDGNIISYSYIPRFSEYHMIKPVQVNKQKKKDLCGYVIMLKKVQQ